MPRSESISQIADRIVAAMQKRNVNEKSIREVCANHRGVNADQAKRAVEKLVATGRATWKYPHPDGRVTRNSAIILINDDRQEGESVLTKTIELNENQIDHLVDVLRAMLDELKLRRDEDPEDEDDSARFEAVRAFYIQLVQDSRISPCAGMRVAKLMQAMRRRGVTKMAVGAIVEYAYDVHPDDMATMLDLHVQSGIARWHHDSSDFGNQTPTSRSVFEILE